MVASFRWNSAAGATLVNSAAVIRITVSTTVRTRIRILPMGFRTHDAPLALPPTFVDEVFSSMTRQHRFRDLGDYGKVGIDVVGDFQFGGLSHEGLGAALGEARVVHQPALHFAVGVLQCFVAGSGAPEHPH